MKGQKLSFKAFLLICAVMPLTSVAQQPYEKWDTGSEELIYREIVTHRIVDQELIDLIVEYDKMYAQFVADSTRGITVFCSMFQEKITYSVCYTFSIGGLSPTLICEPINGREVHLILRDIYKQIQLPWERSAELLKNSDFEQYADIRRGQKEAYAIDGEDVSYRALVNSSFVSWSVVFDNFTGEVLKVNKPNRTKQYEKQKKQRLNK